MAAPKIMHIISPSAAWAGVKPECRVANNPINTFNGERCSVAKLEEVISKTVNRWTIGKPWNSRINNSSKPLLDGINQG